MILGPFAIAVREGGLEQKSNVDAFIASTYRARDVSSKVEMEARSAFIAIHLH